MAIEQFWQIVEAGRLAPEGETRLGVLEKSLRALPPGEVVRFEGHFWDLMSIAYRREIWAVATIIQPACDARCFEAVRGWLILEGKEFFDGVCRSPEVMATRVPRGKTPWLPDGEAALSVASRVYRSLTVEDMPTLPRAVPHVLKGERWTEFDLPEMFPLVWKRYRL